MGYFKGIKVNSDARFVCIFSGLSRVELENKIEFTLIANGYRHQNNGIYVKGNRTKRLLLGALHKYYSFKVSIDDSNPEELLVAVSKESSGMSGGAIGMGQVSTEMRVLGRAFEAI